MMVEGTVEEVATLTFLRLVINLYFTCLLSLYVPVLRTVLSFEVFPLLHVPTNILY